MNLYKMVVRLASLIMAVDALEEGKEAEKVVRNVHQKYIPKEMYSNHTEKFLSSSKVGREQLTRSHLRH